jgi:peptidoglycan/LPS O-acetylase OafA/YrhL
MLTKFPAVIYQIFATILLMEQNSQSGRLHALDGLRGVSILIVFLSHINATFIDRSSLLGGYIFNSGVIGVSFLFILSGFLMAYLYPQTKNKSAFLQKRYTRIFPLFLTLCTFMFILRLIPINQWYVSVCILLIFACISHIIWIFIVKKYIFGNFNKAIFFAFIFIQICTSIFYLWIMNHPAVFYYNQIPEFERLITNFFVNATLTLPVGRYIEMLDPVYWSLAAEVLFYILYPFICAPVIAYMSKRNKSTKIILLLCLIPFFVSVALLSQHILYISLLRLQLFYYFVTGMTLGYLYRKNPNCVTKIGELFTGYLSYLTIVIFFGLIFLTHLITIESQIQNILFSVLLAIPFTLILAISLSNTTALAKLFRSKILVYIGTISYSIYLSHMYVLNTLISITKQPNSEIFTIFYILFALVITVLLSSVLYFLLERPYFIRKYSEKNKGTILYEPKKNTPLLFGGISLRLLMLIFIVYQSNVNFFTLTQPYNNSIIFPYKVSPLISLRKYSKVILQFTAEYNNFGILTLHLLHNSIPNHKFASQKYTFQIKAKHESNWYATSQFYIRHAKDDLPLSFGFPLITNSAGKTYIVSLSQLIPKSSEYIILDSDKNNIAGVFLINKKDIIRHPQQLIIFIENKFITVIESTEAQQELELALPFFLFSLFIFITNIRSIKQKYIVSSLKY